MRFLSPLAIPAALFIACSSTPSVDDYCGKLKARYDACPNSSGTGSTTVSGDAGAPAPRPAFDQARCATSHRCTTTLLEGSVAKSYVDCAGNTDCSVSTSKCDDNALALGSHTAEADTCAKKYAECKTQKKGFDDDYCGTVRALASDPLSKVMPCFEKPCDQIADCYKATLGAVAPGCDVD